MNQTAQARRVLADVKLLRAKLEDEVGSVEWRLYWIAAVVLVRAVGHVLAKVDAARSPSVRAAADRLHREWKGSSNEHAVFRDFIEEERNSILKEYEFGMSEGPIAVIATLSHPSTGEIVEQHALIDENIYRPMRSGPYEGEDGRTLLDEAIEWWESQLALIDLQTEEPSPSA